MLYGPDLNSYNLVCDVIFAYILVESRGNIPYLVANNGGGRIFNPFLTWFYDKFLILTYFYTSDRRSESLSLNIDEICVSE
jgi:hypothetical protein